MEIVTCFLSIVSFISFIYIIALVIMVVIVFSVPLLYLKGAIFVFVETVCCGDVVLPPSRVDQDMQRPKVCSFHEFGGMINFTVIAAAGEPRSKNAQVVMVAKSWVGEGKRSKTRWWFQIFFYVYPYLRK